MTAAANTFHFPSLEIMVKHLSNHPRLTKDAYLQGKTVVVKTAIALANTTKTKEEVSVELTKILLTNCFRNPKWKGKAINLSELNDSLLNLKAAVEYCAKKISKL